MEVTVAHTMHMYIQYMIFRYKRIEKQVSYSVAKPLNAYNRCYNVPIVLCLLVLVVLATFQAVCI